MSQERDLLLITGIPGTSKTCYADKYAKEFGFVHHDLEDQQTQTFNRFNADPAQFIGELLNEKKRVVVTWGFGPDCERSVSLVVQLISAGFKWIWFDGDRPAALREFQKRATVQEIASFPVPSVPLRSDADVVPWVFRAPHDSLASENLL